MLFAKKLRKLQADFGLKLQEVCPSSVRELSNFGPKSRHTSSVP